MKPDEATMTHPFRSVTAIDRKGKCWWGRCDRGKRPGTAPVAY
ncbi:hypothetical protein B005_5048 [Nocardiopsis alba ATCC BAA-2165]|uniref:Uncharacterized protein n=1 Tax=Nocardiopsis alba (strain ATCC BAA-2165 / BE74) TaxID=1205910 RepID=J7L0W4_NOCAA|nr:hypothetical protein B005_5048 [Nocardiopsis alba ATCC BAA-2165]